MHSISILAKPDRIISCTSNENSATSSVQQEQYWGAYAQTKAGEYPRELRKRDHLPASHVNVVRILAPDSRLLEMILVCLIRGSVEHLKKLGSIFAYYHAIEMQLQCVHLALANSDHSGTLLSATHNFVRAAGTGLWSDPLPCSLLSDMHAAH
jgi:hypothetical protein